MAQYVEFLAGFDIQTASAIDKRILLSKEEMFNAETTYLLPDKYFCICKDDGQLYLFDNDSTPDPETKHYHKLEGTKYTAGTGIIINNNQISIDPAIVATITNLNAEIARATTRENAIEVIANSKSIVSAAAGGTSTEVIHYITINGTEFKLPEAGESKTYYAGDGLSLDTATNTFSVNNTIARVAYVDQEVAKKSKVEASSLNGYIKIDGVDTKVYGLPENVVIDANYKHITVNATNGVTDGTNTYKYDDTALSGRVTAVESGLVAETASRVAADTVLSERIDALEGRGRYLSTWNSVTGLPTTEPIDLPYNYKSGDYYLVERVGVTNYKPTGLQYTGVASTVVETAEVIPGDTYYFDGTNWSLVHTPEKQVVWGEIGGTITNQADLQAALNAKASESYVDTKVAAEKERAEGIEAQLSAAVSLKADKTYVDEKLALKADASALSAEVSRATSAEALLATAISAKQDILVAGSNITISGNTISAKDTTYTAGENITISASNVISANVSAGVSKQYVDDKVAAEASLRSSADEVLNAAIQAEATARQSADEILDAKISEKSTVSVSGTGSSTSEVKYITVDGTEYKLSGADEQHLPVTYQTTINYGEDKIAAIDALTAGKTLYNGDIAIVKEIFAGSAGESTSRYQHTAFIYDTTIQEAGTYWKAMDGNYNAENVYFAEDLTYTAAIGVLPKPTSSASLSAKGKNVKEVLSSILAKREYPEAVNPSLTINSANIGPKEVGTTIGITYSTTFNAGSYTYGPATGITASNYQIKFNGQTMTGDSGTFNNVQVNDSTNLVITGTFDHTQGAVPKDNLGDAYPAKQIAAQFAKAAVQKGNLTGYRKMFYGTFNNTDALDSAKIRTLTGIKEEVKPGNSLSVSIPVGAKRVVIAVPNDTETITGKSWSRDVTSVKDVNAASEEVLSAFDPQFIAVEGASNFQAINYKVFICDYANPTTVANTYKVTVI